MWDRGELGRCRLFQGYLIRLLPQDYSGIRGEGSIPVPLPPPVVAIDVESDPVRIGLAASLETPDRLGFPEAKTIVTT